MLTFPAVPPGEDVRVSATAFVAFKRCPAQSEARYRGIFAPETRRSFTGALVHRLIARHLNKGPIGDVDQACKEEIGAGMNPKLVAAGLQRPSQLNEVIAEAGALYQRFTKFPLDGFDSAEVAVLAEPSPGVSLFGKIDAVFRSAGGVLLRDWKSGGLGEPEDQLVFYAVVWTMERGEAPEALEAVSIGTGERFRIVPTEADMQSVLEVVGEMVTAFRTAWASEGAKIERVGGPWCRFCPLLEECVEGRSAMEIAG